MFEWKEKIVKNNEIFYVTAYFGDFDGKVDSEVNNCI
jgi:hypothetical protein